MPVVPLVAEQMGPPRSGCGENPGHTRKRRLSFILWVRMRYISALHGTGVGDLYGSIREAYTAATMIVNQRID